MSKKSIYLIGILLTIIVGAYLNYIYCCDVHEVMAEEVVEVPMKVPTKNEFQVTDPNGTLTVTKNDNFNFELSSATLLTPISNIVGDAVNEVVQYFNEHPDKELTITGYYRSDEDNNSAYPNLGIARASAIKNYFVAKGMPSRHISTRGERLDDMIEDENSILYGPDAFEVGLLSSSEILKEEMEAIAAEIKGKPLLLYFETGAATVKLTPEQRAKVEKIARYLDKVEESTCYIEGHTDNTGTPEGNMVLGQERADFARDYLIRNHIRTSKITAISKGQTEPIASNDTDEGRAQNRRIVVTIN